MSDNPPIEFAFPELRRWEKGAAPYIHVLDSGKPGPVVMVAALTHGNEVSGAVVVDALLAAGLKPRQGTLIFSFNNIEAYHSFDAKTPFKSRLVDEDFNRTWGRLDQPANTVETRRAQVVRPFIERADFLLDLHSMHDDGVPLMLAGPLDKGVALAKKVGTPVDQGRDRAFPGRDEGRRGGGPAGRLEAADAGETAGRRGDACRRHQARQLHAGAALRGPGADRRGRHRAGPRRRRAGDDALRQLRAGDALVEPAAAPRRHGCSPGSIELRPGWRRITKRSSDSLTTPRSAPSAA